MIDELRIINFQSHKETSITLAPGVNAVIGASMAGKSAILRALRLLLYNRPHRGTFCTDGVSEISVKFGDHTVKRVKGKRRNAYIVDDLELKKIGLSVPEEVIQVTEVRALELKNTILELLYSGQLDAPFLLSESGSFGSTILLLLGDIERMNVCLQSLSDQHRECSNRNKFLLEEVDSLSTQLEDYTFLEEYEVALSQAETLDKEVQDAQAVVSFGEQMLNQVTRLENQAAVLSSRLVKYEGVNFAELDAAAADLRQIEEMERYLQSVDYLQQQVEISESKLQLYPLVPDVGELYEAREFFTRASELAVSVNTVSTARAKVQFEIEQLSVALRKALQEAGKCPVCLSDLTPERVEEVLNEVLCSG